MRAAAARWRAAAGPACSAVQARKREGRRERESGLTHGANLRGVVFLFFFVLLFFLFSFSVFKI